VGGARAARVPAPRVAGKAPPVPQTERERQAERERRAAQTRLDALIRQISSDPQSASPDQSAPPIQASEGAEPAPRSALGPGAQSVAGARVALAVQDAQGRPASAVTA